MFDRLQEAVNGCAVAESELQVEESLQQKLNSMTIKDKDAEAAEKKEKEKPTRKKKNGIASSVVQASDDLLVTFAGLFGITITTENLDGSFFSPCAFYMVFDLCFWVLVDNCIH